MSGMLDDNNNIVIPEFMAHIGSNVYYGSIEDIGAGDFVMTLNAIVNGVEASSCTYTYSQ